MTRLWVALPDALALAMPVTVEGQTAKELHQLKRDAELIKNAMSAGPAAIS